jgi:asparagine synthase (glutamine-hydrolysing)
MCGIAGIVTHRPGDRPDPAALEWAARVLQHRGPDHSATWSDEAVGLVHTRLSLVDLDVRSSQPFWDDTRRYALAFNGEIYNFRELRSKLEQQGLSFRTTGDTEVLLALLIRDGVEKTVEQLEGMFAFAFYDTQTRALVLARDRFGMKPLLMHDSPECFAFASEAAALRAWVKLEPDLLSISSYLHGFEGPTVGPSLFRGIRIVPPGSIVRIRPGSVAELTRFASHDDFWDPNEREALERLSARGLVDRLDELLCASVRTQLLADAPVGAFCSGGLDSSVVVALAAAAHPGVAIFHADVVGRHSERSNAEKLARHLKLELKVVEVRDQDFLDTFPAIVRHLGQPFTVRPDATPFFRVCQLAREHQVKGVLSGEASDECFHGYQSMMPDPRAFLRRVPRPSILTARNLYKRVFQRTHAEFERRDALPELATPLHNRFEVDLERAAIRRLRDATGRPIGVNDQKTPVALGFHLRTLLHRNDLIGMAASIETRYPFLDRRVVQFAVNLPSRYKIRVTREVADVRHPFLRDKWILREVAQRYVPRELSHQPKRAFPTNAFKRLRIGDGFFRGSFVSDLFELSRHQVDYLEANARNTFKLRLLHLDTWGNVFIRGCTDDHVLSRLKQFVRIPADRSA